MHTALTIAGSDSSGGAGIQADVKTMTMNGVFAMTAITAITAQNTCGVRAVYEVMPDLLRAQIDAVFEDIRPDAVKIGMVGSVDLVTVIANRLRAHNATCIVVDPVMVATSGSVLADNAVVSALARELFSLATVITPNRPEAEVLSGRSITSERDMERAAQALATRYGCAVLCKGGHAVNDANDVLVVDGTSRWFRGQRVDTVNTHGTGCTLSSAIAAHLAKGFDLEVAIERAKAYVTGALAAGLNLGAGSGPLNHAFALVDHTKEMDT